MRAVVYYRDIPAGILEKNQDGFAFTYYPEYVADSLLPAVSLTLPKRSKAWQSKNMFPFFYGLLAEGINKAIQCRELNIGEEDHFTRMLHTSGEDSVGAVTIKPLEI